MLRCSWCMRSIRSDRDCRRQDAGAGHRRARNPPGVYRDRVDGQAGQDRGRYCGLPPNHRAEGGVAFGRDAVRRLNWIEARDKGAHRFYRVGVGHICPFSGRDRAGQRRPVFGRLGSRGRGCSAADTAVLELAVSEAALRGAPLRVLNAGRLADRNGVAAQLDRRLTAWRHSHPDVEIESDHPVGQRRRLSGTPASTCRAGAAARGRPGTGRHPLGSRGPRGVGRRTLQSAD